MECLRNTIEFLSCQEPELWLEWFMLWFKLPGLKDILSSPLSNCPLYFSVFKCQNSSSFSFFSLGFFSLEWFVCTQFPWVISVVIITSVGKLTHPLTEKYTHTHTRMQALLTPYILSLAAFNRAVNSALCFQMRWKNDAFLPAAQRTFHY